MLLSTNPEDYGHRVKTGHGVVTILPKKGKAKGVLERYSHTHKVGNKGGICQKKFTLLKIA